jgi:hypothetical protein
MSNRHKISVIISNFNGAKYLRKLLDSLRAQQRVELEIIVVDRNSKDESAEILAEYKEVRVMQTPPETGLVYGYHEGYKMASHDLLFFCNEDMWYEPECMFLCAEHTMRPKVATVMPVQMTYDMQNLVQCGMWFEKCSWNLSNPNPFYNSRHRLMDKAVQTSGINAGACLVTREAYEKVRGWDTDFFLDYEDMDLCLRLWQEGYTSWVEPNARVAHAVGASNAKDIEAGKMKVSKKRYIEGSANVCVIALKSFTGLFVIAPLLSIAFRMLKNVIRLRAKMVVWDILVFVSLWKRKKVWLQDRSHFTIQNQLKPGQDFFKEPIFQFTVLEHE